VGKSANLLKKTPFLITCGNLNRIWGEKTFDNEMKLLSQMENIKRHGNSLRYIYLERMALSWMSE
jgi:hypothetical protein